MGKGYLQIGPVTESRINAATRYFEEALAISKKNQIDTLMVRSLWQLVSPYSIQGDLNKALNYANEAFQICSSLHDEKLLYEAYIFIASICDAKKDRFAAMRNYLYARQIAEKLKDPLLLRQTYSSLSGFYGGLKEYDKAIEFKLKQIAIRSPIWSSDAIKDDIHAYFDIGSLCDQKKNLDLAHNYYQLGKKLADSVNYETGQFLFFINIIFSFLENDQPRKAQEFYQANSKKIKEAVPPAIFSHLYDLLNLSLQIKLNNADSARKIVPRFESTNEIMNEIAKKKRAHDTGGILSKIQ